MKILKQLGWHALSAASACASFFLGYFMWKHIDPTGVVYKTPQDLGTVFVILDLVYEISKLKHPVR
jgi:hypothetical protein